MTNHNVFKDDFTPAEERVLKLIVKGYSNKEIGEMLNIANATVKMHLINIYQNPESISLQDFPIMRF